MNTITSFYKKGLKRGFTLIELLVVIAIIGLLSTIIAAPITQARKKGRDGKKVADIRQIVNALQQYADDNNGGYPDLIDNMVPKYLSNVPPNAKTGALAKDKYMYVIYTDTTVPGHTRNLGFHLGSKLEAVSLSLKDDRDCMGIGVVDDLHHFCLDIANIQSADQANASSTASNCNGLCSASFANWVDGAQNLASMAYPVGINPDDIGLRVGDNTPGNGSSSFKEDFSGGNADELANCDASTLDDVNSTTTCVYDVTN